MTATYNGSMNDHSSGTSRPTRSPNQFGKEPQAEYQRRIKQGVHFKAASCIRNFRAAVAQVELPDQACGTCQYHGRRHEPIEGRPYRIARSAVVVYRRNDKVHGHGESQQESVCARNALNSSHDPFISFSFPRLAAIAGGVRSRINGLGNSGSQGIRRPPPFDKTPLRQLWHNRRFGINVKGTL